MYELIQFKEEFRSWFIGNSVQHGKLFCSEISLKVDGYTTKGDN